MMLRLRNVRQRLRNCEESTQFWKKQTEIWRNRYENIIARFPELEEWTDGRVERLDDDGVGNGQDK